MNPVVEFHSADIDFLPDSPEALANWIEQIAALHKKEIHALSFVFCSDNYLLEINQKYLNHNYFTDVITFNLSENDKIEGEVYISIERVKENARTEKITFEAELHRVMIHGILHLIGYSDITSEEKKLMTHKENEALQNLKMFHVKH